MNFKLNLQFKPAAIIAWLKNAQPYLVGVALIGVFGYTAWSVNQALNTPPAEVAVPAAAVTFDKTTLASLKALTSVNDQVPSIPLGKSDPFGN